MALTPTEVHAQQFTTVRMRTGYDMDEVDAFLDVVEAEISRLLGDNDDFDGSDTSESDMRRSNHHIRSGGDVGGGGGGGGGDGGGGGGGRRR